MSWFEIAYLLLLAALVIWGVWWRAQRDASAKRNKLDEPEQWTPPQPQAPSWQALPGAVLELAYTGFSICHRPDDPRSDYFLYSPEGQFMCAVPAGNLEGLMKFGERCAQERRLFSGVKPFPAITPPSNHDR